MEKFSQLNENQTYDDFPLTESEFQNYKEFINELLGQMFPKRIVNLADLGKKPLIVYKAYNYEKAQAIGRVFSVLGKVNTNKELIKNIWFAFKIKDYNHLKNFISKFRDDLFQENGRFFKSGSESVSVWDTIRATEKIGEMNEQFVANCIIETWGSESNPIREVTSSYKDMVLGIDITFKIDGVEKTCKVKPLVSDNFKERGIVVVETKGVMKQYKTDFIAFVNPKRVYRSACLFFKNKDLTISSKGKIVTLPYQNLVRIKIPITTNVNKT
jgi:hypothetical protein